MATFAATLLTLALFAAGATAAPATLRLTDVAPSLGRTVTLSTPDGRTFTNDPGRPAVRLTSAGTTEDLSAWCIAPLRGIRVGVDYAVDVRTAAEDPALNATGYREAAWLAAQADALLAAAPDPGLEAAAIQVAVWQLTGGVTDAAEPSSDAALNARTRDLRATARDRALAAAVALTATPATVAPGTPVEIDVTGTPGAEVDLAVKAGTGTLSATRVRLDAAGTARVQLVATAGPVTVAAAAAGGVPLRIVPVAGARSPQDLLAVRPTTLTTTTTVTVVAPAITPAGGPVVTPPAGPRKAIPAALRLVKRGPKAVRAGTLVRYTLTVRNAGTVTARRVVLRDRLPAGTVLPHRPRGVQLRHGAVVWRIGAIAPGRSVRRILVLRLLDTTRGRVVNRATARAANAALVRARTVTPVIPARVAPVRAPVAG